MTGTEKQEAAAEQVQAEREQLAMSWEPESELLMRTAFRGERAATVATQFERTDSVCLLYPGKLNMFLGEPEGCKTWAALVSITQAVKKGQVCLFIDFEDDIDTAAERFRQLGLTEDEFTNRVVYVNPTEEFSDCALERVKTRLRVSTYGWGIRLAQNGVGVAVIDSMTEAMAVQDLDPNVGKDVNTFYHSLPSRLSELGFAVVILDHVTKSREGRSRWAIGSERKISGLNGVAYGFNARQPFGRGVTGKVELTVTKDRPGFVRKYSTSKHVIGTLVLISDPITSNIEARVIAPESTSPTEDVIDSAASLVTIRDAVVEALLAHPYITGTELRQYVPHHASKTDDARNSLQADGIVGIKMDGKRKLFYAC